MRTRKFIRRKAASRYLKTKWGVVRAPATLAKYAVFGTGPTFQRDGRVPIYSTDDLDRYAVSTLSGPMPPKAKASSEEIGSSEDRGRTDLDEPEALPNMDAGA